MRLTLPYPLLADALAKSGWLRFASPSACYGLAGRLLPWFWGAAALFGLAGLAAGLLVAPSDTEHGDAYRIIFLHVPATWMSMIIFLTMAAWVAVGLALNTPVSTMLATALAPTGALMTLVALWTGALWDRPTWGTWWVWDARLMSELLLLLLYLAFMAMQATRAEWRRGDRTGAILLLVGVANVPILFVSAQWWPTLQQGTWAGMDQPSGLVAVVVGMLLMLAALWSWSIAVSLHRLRSIILEHERDSEWARSLPEAN